MRADHLPINMPRVSLHFPPATQTSIPGVRNERERRTPTSPKPGWDKRRPRRASPPKLTVHLPLRVTGSRRPKVVGKVRKHPAPRLGLRGAAPHIPARPAYSQRSNSTERLRRTARSVPDTPPRFSRSSKSVNLEPSIRSWSITDLNFD